MGSIVFNMASPSGTPENVVDIEKEISEFLDFQGHQEGGEQNVCGQLNASNDVEEKGKRRKNAQKRKKDIEDNISPNILSEVFLRIFYPISSSLDKSVLIGVMKSTDYSPTVILTHGPKMILFTDSAWESFMKHLHLLECYLSSNMFGRKTRVGLLDSNVEIDIIKHRGDHQLRFRDTTRHDNKIQLNREEFFILTCATEPITRYLRQLVFSSSIIKDYLEDTLDKQPDAPILYGPVDTSIFNRVPHEVQMWRQLEKYAQLHKKSVKREEEKEEGGEESSVSDENENKENVKMET